MSNPTFGHYTQLLTLSANPSNGETVTIDGKVYTFQSSLTNVNGNVKIGVSAAITLCNLAGAMNLRTVGAGSGAGVGYAAAMTLNANVRAYEPTAGNSSTLKVYAMVTGATGAYAVSETLSNGSWGAAALSSASLYYPSPVEISQASTVFTNVAPLAKSIANLAAISVRIASTENIDIATIDMGTQTTDDVLLSGDGELFLAKDQTNAEENGVYSYPGGGGVPTRYSGASTAAQLGAGLVVRVLEGTVNKDKKFQLKTPAPIVVDTTDLEFIDLTPGVITPT